MFYSDEIFTTGESQDITNTCELAAKLMTLFACRVYSVVCKSVALKAPSCVGRSLTVSQSSCQASLFLD